MLGTYIPNQKIESNGISVFHNTAEKLQKINQVITKSVNKINFQ